MINSFSGEHRFLSNFYPSPIMVLGIEYSTVEHFFQAMKATTQEDHDLIRNAESPGKAKRLGKTIQRRADWEEVRVNMMRQGLTAKFRQNSGLRLKLLATGTEELIEGNTWGDVYWGVCNGIGENMLGKLLMEIRANYRQTTVKACKL